MGPHGLRQPDPALPVLLEAAGSQSARCDHWMVSCQMLLYEIMGKTVEPGRHIRSPVSADKDHRRRSMYRIMPPLSSFYIVFVYDHHVYDAIHRLLRLSKSRGANHAYAPHLSYQNQHKAGPYWEPALYDRVLRLFGDGRLTVFSQAVLFAIPIDKIR